MPLKKNITDRAVKELYQVMATEHFARLSTLIWRLVNEWQRAKTIPEADINVLEVRIQHLEQKADRLLTKLEALEGILSRRTKAARTGIKTPRPKATKQEERK